MREWSSQQQSTTDPVSIGVHDGGKKRAISQGATARRQLHNVRRHSSALDRAKISRVRKLEDIIAEQDRPDDRDLRSRTDATNARKTEETRLADLARRLVGLPERTLAKVALPENVLDAVADARRMKSHIAQNRQLRIVRKSLRASESEDISRQVEALVSDDGRPSLTTREAQAWVDRLLEGGDAALAEMVDAHGNADRQQLRQLIRNTKRADEARAPLKRKALLSAIREILEGSRADSTTRVGSSR